MKSESASNVWRHIWILEGLFGVLLNHAGDVSTTTFEEGFSMDFTTSDITICSLIHLEGKTTRLAVNVQNARDIYYALMGVAHEHKIDFVEFAATHENGSPSVTTTLPLAT